MKKVLVDTNVILDLLAKREKFYKDSLQLFSLADKAKLQIVISTLSIANTYYLLNDILKFKGTRAAIRKFKVLVESYPMTDKIVELALNDNGFKDFEDGIQYYSALESNCSAIVTRNIKDFKNSGIPIFRPNEYLKRINVQ